MPLAPGASALEPASIQRPTVEVEAPGMVSVETLRPLERVDVLVTGSAATVTGCTAARFLASDWIFSGYSSATNGRGGIWGGGEGGTDRLENPGDGGAGDGAGEDAGGGHAGEWGRGSGSAGGGGVHQGDEL